MNIWLFFDIFLYTDISILQGQQSNFSKVMHKFKSNIYKTWQHFWILPAAGTAGNVPAAALKYIPFLSHQIYVNTLHPNHLQHRLLLHLSSDFHVARGGRLGDGPS